MAISGKDAQVWMWRVLKYSMRSAYTLVKNHPFISCPLLFFSVLYTIFPSFFWISLYSLAFLMLAVSVTRIYLRRRNAKSFRRDEKNSDAESIRKDGFAKNGATENRNEKSFTRARSVRRRKPKETSRDSSVHTSEDEKSILFPSTFNNEMVDKTALTEERPKEIREIEVDSIICHAEFSSSNDSSGLRPELHDTSYEESRKFGGCGDIEIESSEGTDEEDEQEREANKKAVQWTEADQKNLMDLGFSEIERNKRLESLIARRRARKLLSLQVRRSLVNMDSLENHGPMTSLTIPRSINPFLASQTSRNFSPMPGSAPSVLLPNHNPFDLPYDPQEEKPNLTGGSFHLEFEDMTFSRHENVGLGASFPGGLKEDRQEKSLSHDSTKEDGVPEGHENSIVNGKLDEKDTDKIIEVESCQAPKSNLNTVTADKVIKEEVPDSKQGMDLGSNCQEEKSSEIQTKSVLIEDSIDKLSSTSSSEDDVPIFRVDKDAVLRSLASPLLRNISMNREGSSQMGYVGNGNDPSVFDKNKMQEHFSHADKAMHYNHHTPMSSIASDLQVEVSEVSSPALTDDGRNSSPDEEFSSYKGDMESESTAGNEDIGETSSQLPRIDENELKELCDTNEHNTVEVGFSRTKESENYVSHELSEKVIEQNATDLVSLSAMNVELPDRSQDHASTFHSNIEDNFQSSASSDLSRTLASDSLAFPVMDKVQQLKGNPMANTSQNDDSEKPEQLSYSSKKSKGELNSIYNVDDSKVLQNNDKEFSILETDDLVDLLIEQGRRQPTKLSETSSSKSVDCTGSQPEKIEEQRNILELVGKNVDPKISEDIEGDLKDTKQDKMEDSMAIEDNDTLESIQVDEDERHRAELRSSGVHRNFSDHQVWARLPASVLEQFHIASSASSPRSVLRSNFSIEPSSLSNFSDDTHVEIHAFHPQRIENSMLDEARGEGLTCTLPQSTMHLMVDSRSYPLHEGSAEILEEFSNHSTSTKEVNTTGSVSEDTVHENERKQNETNYIPEGSSGRRESTNLSTFTAEANFSGSVSEDMVHENVRRQNKTNYMPEDSSGRQESSNLSTSAEEDNSMGSVSQKLIHENEIRPNEMKVIPEGSLQKLSSPDSTAALSKLRKEINSDLPDVGQETSNSLTSNKEANSIGSVSEQDIKEDEKKQNETKSIPEGSSNSSSCYESKAGLSKPMEESNSHLPLLASNEEANSMGTVSEQVIPESERRQYETKDICEGRLERLSPESTVSLSKGIREISSGLPHTGQESSNLSASPEEANSIRFVNEHIIHENEKGQNEATDIPEGNSQGLSSPDATAALSKPIEDISSRSLIMTDDRSDKLHKHEAENEALPALLNPIEQVNKLNTPIINREEISQFQGNPFGVIYKEEVLNPVDGEAQASTNATTSKAALSKPIEESNSHLPALAPNEEANSMGTVSEQVIPESERRQYETKDICEGRLERLSPESKVALSKLIGEISSDLPHTGQESSNLSASPEEANSVSFVNEHLIHDNEKGRNEAKDTLERSSQGLSSPDATAALSKPIEDISSRSLTMTDDRSYKLHKHEAENEALPALFNPIEQVNKLNTPIINREEISQFQGNPFGVTYKEEVLNPVDGEALASTNATTSKAALSKPIKECNSHLLVLASNEEANSMGTVSEQVIPESERRQYETKDICEGRLEMLSPESTVTLSKGIGEISSDLPHTGQESSNLSASPEEANSIGFVNEHIIHENEKGQSEAKDIPEGNLQGLSRPDATAALLKPIEDISSRSLTMTDDRSYKLHKHEAENEALPALLNPIEQVNKLNTPIINREQEISQFHGNPFGVTYKERVLNSVDDNAQASTNATTSKDSPGTMDKLQRLSSYKDHTGLLIVLETSKVSTDKYPSKSADEKKGGFSKPVNGESKVSSPKEITEVEPSKSAEENNRPNNHMFSTETEITRNYTAGRSSEEEVTGNPNTEKTPVSQTDGPSKHETVKEVPKA